MLSSDAGTFKIKKLALQREGYNPETVADPLFFLDPQKSEYVKLDHAAYASIQEQKARL